MAAQFASGITRRPKGGLSGPKSPIVKLIVRNRPWQSGRKKRVGGSFPSRDNLASIDLQERGARNADTYFHCIADGHG